jgi:preprotein translocase subunit YajC
MYFVLNKYQSRQTKNTKNTCTQWCRLLPILGVFFLGVFLAHQEAQKKAQKTVDLQSVQSVFLLVR